MYYPMDGPDMRIPININYYYPHSPNSPGADHIVSLGILSDDANMKSKIFFSVNNAAPVPFGTYYHVPAVGISFPLKVSIFYQGPEGYRLLSRVNIPYSMKNVTKTIYVDPHDVMGQYYY